MSHSKDNKNRILEIITVNGIKYIKDAINSKALSIELASKGSKVDLFLFKTKKVKKLAKVYI